MRRTAKSAPFAFASGRHDGFGPPKRWRLWGALALLTMALAWLAGCGYEMDAPRLPNDRRTIAVEPIRNRTFEAELDVRLQQQLRRRLFRTAGIRVVPPERSDLVLDIELRQLALNRARDITSTDVTSLVYQLSGTMTLRDAGSGKLIFERLPISVSSSYQLPEASIETPAVSDEALNNTIAAFADAVIQELLRSF